MEMQKERFSEHIATLTDLGSIKILDFKRPGSCDYRIRFMFEEDYCRLHISGDLGELIACNYNNMTYAGFSRDFASNPDYFREKILCHNRALDHYTYELAETQLRKWLADECCDEPEDIDGFVHDVLDELDNRHGLSEKGVDMLMEYAMDSYEAYSVGSELGKEPTGIIELYLLAFRLAQKQLEEVTNGD